MSDTYTGDDFVQQQNLWRLRNNVLRAALRVHLDYLDPDRPVGTVGAHDQSFDDAVLDLAHALRPLVKVPEVIVKIDGELSQDAAMKIQRALNRLHRQEGKLA